MTKIESVVKNALLNGKDFSTKRGWIIKISNDDKVQIWPPTGEGRETTLAFLDKAVTDFCRQADVMAPGVNQTNPPKSTSDGSLGKDTSGKSPKKFDPSVNKTPKPDGSFTDKSLGSDTSTDEGFSTPSINKDMTPDDEGLTDTDLGSDSSGNSTKFDNKVVNVQSDGRTGKKTAEYTKKLEIAISEEAAGDWGYYQEEFMEYWKEMIQARLEQELQFPEEVFIEIKITDNDDHVRCQGFADDRQTEQDIDFSVVSKAHEEAQSTFDPEGTGFIDPEGPSIAKGGSKIQDTFASGPDPSEIYRKLNAKSVSKELLAGILNEEEWEAQQRLAQMDKMSPKRGPGMPGKGKATYSDGAAGGQIGAGCEAEKEAVAPPGWEKTVKKMKDDPEIDNEYALAWSMKNKGYTPGGKDKKSRIAGPKPGDWALQEPKGAHEYEVIVGNIGSVYAGDDVKEAINTYSEYKEQSLANYGRASGESVTLFCDGEIWDEFHSERDARKSTKTAGPKLREKWLQDGGYHREIESESAEELHALVQGFSGEDVDWAKFKPAMPEEKEAEEVQQQPVQEGAGAAPVTAKSAQWDDDTDWETNPEYWAESYINGNISDTIQAVKTGKVSAEAVADVLREIAGADETVRFLKAMSRNAQAADIEAVDEEAKDTINNYMGEYGKELTKDDGVAPKGKNPKKMLDKGKGKKGQAAPAPATPAPAPTAPAAPAAPGGQAPAGGAPAPKAPAPKAPQGLQPGVGDAGIQALGWTAEDVQSMTDEQKKGILQLKLTKPGTQQKQQVQPKTPAPKTPAPGGPGTPPAGPQGPAAPGSEPAPPAPSAPAPKATKGAKKVKRSQAAPLPQTEEAPAAPAQDAPQSPAAPAKAPATPAAPKGPAKPAGQPAQDPGQAGGGQEQQAFQILQEVQQMQVNAATPNEVSTAKVSQLLERLLTELGVTPDQASKLFGLQKGNFGALFK